MSEKSFEYRPRELDKDNAQHVAEAEKPFEDARVDSAKFEEYREKIHKQFQHLGEDRIPTDEEVTEIINRWAGIARDKILSGMKDEDQAELDERLESEKERITAEIRAKRTFG